MALNREIPVESILRMDADRQSLLRRELTENGYAVLRGFLDAKLLAAFDHLVDRTEAMATRRDFVMPGYRTPRLMSTLGGRVLRERVPELAAFYDDDRVLELLSGLVGRGLHRSTHADECIVVNFLKGEGQTHGWHIDDPEYALVIVVRASPFELGGNVELLRDFDPAALAVSPREEIARAQVEGRVESLSLGRGDAYILHASKILHRVTRLKHPTAERAAINFAFDTRAVQTYGPTASILYGTVPEPTSSTWQVEQQRSP